MSLFDPKTTAAIYIDVQEAVLAHHSEPEDAPTVFARQAKLAQAMRQAGGTNIFVRTSYLPDEADGPQPVRDEERPKRVREDNWDQVVDMMEREPNEPIVTKRTFNAFYGSDLDLQLRRRGIKTILLAGISTNLGVEGTARSAYDRGFHIVFVTDAMGTHKAENHEYSVREIFPLLGQNRTLDAVLNELN